MDEVEIVKRRIAARQWAEECWEAEDDREAFCQRIAALGNQAGYLKKFPERKPVVPPMSDKEAKEFKSRIIPFGIHKGSRISDVPLSYLCYLTDPSAEMDRFMLDVRRYLRNPVVKRKVEEE